MSALILSANFCHSTSSDLVAWQKLSNQVIQPGTLTFMWHHSFTPSNIMERMSISCQNIEVEWWFTSILCHDATKIVQLLWFKPTSGRVHISIERPTSHSIFIESPSTLYRPKLWQVEWSWTTNNICVQTHLYITRYSLFLATGHNCRIASVAALEGDAQYFIIWNIGDH